MIPSGDACVTVSLAAPDDFTGWRDHARRLVKAAVPPELVVWTLDQGSELFANSSEELPPACADRPSPRVPRAFLDLARTVILHSDPARFAVLYGLLWRLQGDGTALEDMADPVVRRAEQLARVVRRDIHKMRAFVRFREIEDADGAARFVAWFEPDHHILRANAAFFTGRFANMRWSILTPQGSLHWDGAVLSEGPPAQRDDAPAGDAAEDLWRAYYASIFNPARLKVGAMVKEMPRRYWKNMPEAALIPALVAGARARELAMVEQGEARFADEPPTSLDAVAEGAIACRRCVIGCNGTRAVMGEGPDRASLIIVGEQPGENEEQVGRPFIGPAGQVLRQHLQDAGIDIDRTYVTNAVKHFKFTQHGKRRLHQTPTAGEIDMCRWWLEAERALIRPRLVLALGVSAARSLLGRTVSLQRERDRGHALDDGSELWLTSHPSYLLRLDGVAREDEERRFSSDLRKIYHRLMELHCAKITPV